jgi:hypothetical protein
MLYNDDSDLKCRSQSKILLTIIEFEPPLGEFIVAAFAVGHGQNLFFWSTGPTRLFGNLAVPFFAFFIFLDLLLKILHIGLYFVLGLGHFPPDFVLILLFGNAGLLLQALPGLLSLLRALD